MESSMTQKKIIITPRIFRNITAVLLGLMLFACAAAPNAPAPAGSVRIIESVPFFSQEDYQCGPAAMASVLNYRGIKIRSEEIASAIYSKSARGTLNFDMVFFAEKKGLYARQYPGNLADLKYRIDNSHPLIVMVDYGFLIYQKDHFMVVVGYDSGNIIVHSGKDSFKRIPIEDFLKTWQKTKNWTLLIQKTNMDLS
jgi:ABC-type bacteriocin/lantibiotic exporter with double-glycine peptidase domain